MKTQLIKTVKQFSILLLLVSFINGCIDEDSFLPNIVSDFTYTINPDTGTVTFINISENSTSYEWNFGDETTSTEINPVHTYVTGEYTITLKSSNVAGASNVFEDTIAISIPEIITFPITFDNPKVGFDATTFGGASFAIVDNPEVGGTNAVASLVGVITNSGAAFEGFYFDLGTPIDLDTNKAIKINFYSSSSIDVTIKLEEGTGAIVEATASHGGTGWEEIYFTFTSSDKFSRITFFVDGAGTTSGVFYIDDLMQISISDIPCTDTLLELPMDFDCNGIDYATKIVGNVSFTVVDNPELSGVNTTASKVGQITNTGVNWENAFFNLDTPVDFTTDKGIRLKLYSTQTLPIKLKFEDGTGAPVEADVNHTGSGWEELTFNFTSSDSYNDMILFIDGPGTAAGTFYVDDLEQVSVTPPPPACTTTTLELPIDFDCDGIDYVSKDSGDVAFEVIDNPELSGINATLSKVAKLVFDSNQPWENMNLTLDTPVDFSTNKSIKMKFFASEARALKLKFEGGGAATEVDVNHTGSGWEELTFTVNSADTFTNLIVFVDGGANTVGTFYVDDIEQVIANTVCTQTTLELPVDFDCAGIDYVSKDSGDVAFEVIDNPELSGINATLSKVAKLVFDSNQPWENMNLNLDAPVDFSTDKAIKMKFFASEARTLKLKFEGGGAATEVDVNHTGSGWEELTFTVNSADTFTNLIVFVDGGANTVGTFYVDDIEQIATQVSNTCTPPAGDLVTNGDFETGTDSCWDLFQNGGTSALDNTTNNGGAWSGKLTTNGPSNPAFKQERKGAGTVMAGDLVTITFDHMGSVVQPGAVFNVLLFGEGAGGASFTHVFNPAPALSGTWTSYTGTFTIPPGTDVSEGISFLIEAVCGGDAGCSVTANIDNVSITLN